MCFDGVVINDFDVVVFNSFCSAIEGRFSKFDVGLKLSSITLKTFVVRQQEVNACTPQDLLERKSHHHRLVL